jgi:hypothetical protein
VRVLQALGLPQWFGTLTGQGIGCMPVFGARLPAFVLVLHHHFVPGAGRHGAGRNTPKYYVRTVARARDPTRAESSRPAAAACTSLPAARKSKHQ